MLLSLAVIFLCGMGMGAIFRRLNLPQLLGMLLTGILLGPYALNLLDGSILSISADLRQIALIIILTRAGLNLDVADLKKVGRAAVLMCFVPASFEILGMLALAPRILGISLLDAAIMGTVVGAVSPAVIVPKMLKLMDERYGTRESIPQLIMAGASVDDVFVIVLFTSFTGLAQGGTASALDLMRIPTSIVLGLAAGAVCGLLLALAFRKIHMRDSAKVIIILSISFLLVTLEHSLSGALGFSGLLAVMGMGIALQRRRGGGGGQAVRQILQALGGRGAAAVRAGGRHGGRGLRAGLRGSRGAPDLRRAGLSDGRSVPVPVGHQPGPRGTAVLHDRLHAEGYGSGGDRGHPAVHGAGLRTDCPYGGGALHFDHRAAGFLPD